MTIEKLEGFRAACVELADIDARLEELKVRVTVPSGSQFPYTVRSVTYPPELPPTDEVQALLERQAALKAYISEVDEFVRSIPSDRSDIKVIVEQRYIRGNKGRSWQFIAMRLGFCSEHTPLRRLKKYLRVAEKAEIVCYNLYWSK